MGGGGVRTPQTGGDPSEPPLPPPGITHLCLGEVGGAFLPPPGLCPLAAALSLGDGGGGRRVRAWTPPKDPNIGGGGQGTKRALWGPPEVIWNHLGAIWGTASP